MEKVMIAIATGGNIEPETFKSIFMQVQDGFEWLGGDGGFTYFKGYVIHHSRERLAELAIEAGADRILYVDSDVAFLDPLDVSRLMSHGDMDVVFGYYPRRNGVNGSDAYDGRTSLIRIGRLDYKDYYDDSELVAMRERGQTEVDVHGGGAGCMLVRTRIFSQVERPWFYYRLKEGGSQLSEDYWFCNQCHLAGVPLVADTRVRLKHLFRTWQEPR